jgi:hypothetical protein
LDRALTVFSGPGGINDQLTALSLNPAIPLVGSILNLSSPVDAYEKATAVKYPVVTVYCERLRNTQNEKFRMLSGIALMVVEIRVSGERAEALETNLNSYVQAATQVLDGARGPWTDIGTYTGAYHVKFQAMRSGGKQFVKSVHIEFEILISR